MVHKQRSIFEYMSSRKTVGNDQQTTVSTPTVVKIEEETKKEESIEMFCPICEFELTRYTLEARSVHVNRCIDPPLGKRASPQKKRPKTADSVKVEGETFLEPLTLPSGTTTQEDTRQIKEEQTGFEKVNLETAPDELCQPDKGKKRRRSGKVKPPIPDHKILSFPSAGEENVIAVDAFCYSPHASISIYLLTHFHSDHYGGLCKSWDNGEIIICTPITSRLMQLKFKFPQERMFILENYGVPTSIPGTDVQVTVYDANHCPGAGIYVVECSGTRYLHCGDFRASSDMIDKLSAIYPTGFDKCYLDTTYLHPTYTFPNQSEVVSSTSEWIKQKCAIHKSKQQRVVDFFRSRAAHGFDTSEFLVVIGTYSIGKEKLALGISKALNTRIFCPKEKYEILKQYEWDELTQRLNTDDGMNCGVHLLPLGKTRKDMMVEYLKKYASKYKAIMVVVPTGWTYGYGAKQGAGNSAEAKPVKTQIEQMVDSFERGFNVGGSRGDFVTVRKIQVPYSEHSSFAELSQFVQCLDVREWIPTVNMGSVGKQLQLIRQLQGAG